MMKRIAILVSTALMALVLSACGNNPNQKTDTNAAANAEQTQDGSDTNATSAPAASEPATTAAPEESAAPADSTEPAAK